MRAEASVGGEGNNDPTRGAGCMSEKSMSTQVCGSMQAQREGERVDSQPLQTHEPLHAGGDAIGFSITLFARPGLLSLPHIMWQHNPLVLSQHQGTGRQLW